MSITEFNDIHKGKNILLVGNGANLELTPPEKFDIPSIGMNTIHKYEGWSPDYYITVDRRVYREFGTDIEKKFIDIPKFIPTPRLQMWKGENFHYFKSGQGGLLWPGNRLKLWQDDISTGRMVYGNVMHVAVKLAYYMGASKILIVGMEHKPKKADIHFWGKDKGMKAGQPTKTWQEGYKILCEELDKRNVELLNISQETFVPDSIIPTDDWKKFSKKPKAKGSVLPKRQNVFSNTNEVKGENNA